MKRRTTPTSSSISMRPIMMSSHPPTATPLPLLLLVLLVVVATATAQKSSAPTTTSFSGNAKPLRFSSPLQSYTVFDRASPSSDDTVMVSPRRKFLPRFRAGLVAERRAREVLAEERRRGMGLDDDGDDDDLDRSSSWAEASAAADERKKKAAERRVEAAYDAAVRSYDERVAAKEKRSPATAASSSSGNEYQFVGVVNDGSKEGKKKGDKEEAVTWYARKKPKNSKWSVRVVHVNRDAVLRDLFVRGKVDIYGRYLNEGLDGKSAAFAAADNEGGEGGEEKRETGLKPLVKAKYEVKERSWRTLWNFSPVRMFASPSGSFWRERRISPGLYTDGNRVYETVYRYRDGKNGLKPVAKLGDFLAGPGIGSEEKMRVVERMKRGDAPDLVIEK